LDDDTVFVAEAAENPALTSAPPAAFGFLGDTVSGIEFDRPRFLSVPEGKTLSAVGGSVTVKGSSGVTTLQARGGRIQLASIGATETEVPTDLMQFDAHSFAEDQLGSTIVALSAVLDTRNPAAPAAPQGRVVIRGGRFVLDNGEIFAGAAGNEPAPEEPGPAIDFEVAGEVDIRNGSTAQSSGAGTEAVGGVRIVAETVQVRGESVVKVQSVGAGPGGVIHIEAGAVDVADHAQLLSLSESSGKGADIDVTAQTVTVTEGGEIASLAQGSGPGGVIGVKADEVRVTEGAQISAIGEASGTTGGIAVYADDVEVSGVNAQISTINAASSAGGDVEIMAESIRVSDTGLIATETSGSASDPSTRLGGNIALKTGTLDVSNAGRVQTLSLGSGAGGDLGIDAQRIVASRGSEGAEPGQLAAVADSDGDGGRIGIQTGSLELRDGGQISTTTEAAGKGGDLDIVATEGILLTGVSESVPSGIFAQSGHDKETLATGKGGELLIDARVLELKNGANVSARTFGYGDAGNVEILVSDRVTISGGAATGSSILSAQGVDGDGGDLIVETDVLELLDGGEISASTNRTGRSGDVTISARRLLISGADSRGNRSGVFAQANAPEAVSMGGNAGNLEITTTEWLRVLDGGWVSVASKGSGRSGNISIRAGDALEVADGGEISAQASHTGDAGSITIEDTDTVEVSSAAITTQTTGSAEGGTIAITAGNRVSLFPDGKISAESTESGDAGDITINAGQRLVLQGRSSSDRSATSISTRAENAFGGSIRISAAQGVDVINGEISTSVRAGVGDGGNISIDPEFVVLNHSDITAQADVGNGGNIRIETENFVQSADSVVDASSRLGISGTVEITAPDADLSADIVTLPASFLDASSLLRQSCSARTARAGSLVVRGRDRIPASPDAPLRGFYLGGHEQTW
jgi:large exoprotein involved in heme utilization and adhesion